MAKDKVAAMESIPTELLLEYCTTVDLLRLSRTSKRFEQICKNTQTWYYYLRKDYHIKYEKSSPIKKYTQIVLKEVSKLLTKFGYYYREIYDKLQQIYTPEMLTMDKIAEDEHKYKFGLGFSHANILWHSSRYYELALACLNIDVEKETCKIHNNLISEQIVGLLRGYHRYPNTLFGLLIYKTEMEEYLLRIVNYVNDLKQRPSTF